MEIFDYDNILLLPRKCRVDSRAASASASRVDRCLSNPSSSTASERSRAAPSTSPWESASATEVSMEESRSTSAGPSSSPA